MSDPFISHSEITDAIYIVCGTKKYNVTEQVIRAMRETGRLEQQRPHGEWEFIGDNLFKCTHCGYIADACYLREWKVHTYDAEFPTACLKCGADMREGDPE